MGVVDTSENGIMSEFAKTGLPSSSLVRFSMYYKDLDRYYSLRGLNSPRMPRRVAFRAFSMTSFFNHLLENGQSPVFADDYVRNFLDIPGTNLDRDPMVYIREYCRRRLLAGDPQDRLASDVALFLIDQGVRVTPDGKYDLSGIREHFTAKENDSRIPRKRLDDSIFHMRRLLMNKHLRRHCATASNSLFIDRKVALYVNDAVDAWSECSEIVEEDPSKVSAKVMDDMMLLFILTEHVKDFYLLYE